MRDYRVAVIVFGLLLLSAAHLSAKQIPADDVFSGPGFGVLTVGLETPSWNWTNGSAHADGWYTDEDRDSFYLEGNGHSIYQCWDEMGFAFITEAELTGDFQLTARFAELPDEGPGSIGLTLKSSLDAISPVLDLRWDYYYPELADNPNGLRWFNRITPSSSIGLCNDCEAGLCQGTECHTFCTSKPDDPDCWEGCLNQGYENFADPDGGFTQKDGLWVRVRREAHKFFLYATYDTTDWMQIQPVTLKGTPLGYFRLPETEDSLVYAGFSCVGTNKGGHIQTATFDNISLEVYSYYEKETGTADGAKPVHKAAPRAVINGSSIVVPDGAMVRAAEIYGAHGRKVGSLTRSGNQFTIPNKNRIPSGAYWIRMNVSGDNITIPYVIQ